MYTFTRVEPRDLFNTSKCLKCFGHLIIQLSQPRPEALARLFYEFEHDAKDDYHVEQDQTDGDLLLAGFTAWVYNAQIAVVFFTKYNSQDAYPMFADVGDLPVRVFKEDGSWHPDFIKAFLYATSPLH